MRVGGPRAPPAKYLRVSLPSQSKSSHLARASALNNTPTSLKHCLNRYPLGGEGPLWHTCTRLHREHLVSPSRAARSRYCRSKHARRPSRVALLITDQPLSGRPERWTWIPQIIQADAKYIRKERMPMLGGLPGDSWLLKQVVHVSSLRSWHTVSRSGLSLRTT